MNIFLMKLRDQAVKDFILSRWTMELAHTNTDQDHPQLLPIRRDNVNIMSHSSSLTQR